MKRLSTSTKFIITIAAIVAVMFLLLFIPQANAAGCSTAEIQPECSRLRAEVSDHNLQHQIANQTRGWYAGVAAGYSATVSIDNYEPGIDWLTYPNPPEGDNDSLAVRLYMGRSNALGTYQGASFGVELGYANLGEFYGIESEAIDATVTAWLPINQRIDVLLRFGAAYTNTNTSDEIGATIATGLTYTLGKLRLRSEYQIFADLFKDRDVDVVWLGATRRY